RVVGCRDYAIVLLLVRLGLRSGEVAAMQLEDIDWRAGDMLVRGKGGRQDRLPLPADVGEALPRLPALPTAGGVARRVREDAPAGRAIDLTGGRRDRDHSMLARRD